MSGKISVERAAQTAGAESAQNKPSAVMTPVPVGGLNISGPSTRMTLEKREEMRELLLAMAVRINLKL